MQMALARTRSPVSYQTAFMTRTQKYSSAVGMMDTQLMSLIFPLTRPSFCSSIIPINVRWSIIPKSRKNFSAGTMKMSYPIILKLKANTPFWISTVIISKSTTVIIINRHKNIKFSRMHYLLKYILRN